MLLIFDYLVELGVTSMNANEAVAAADPAGAPPAQGRQFVMVPVSATYGDGGRRSPSADLTIEFLAADGVTYGEQPADDCGPIPDSFADAGEVSAGGNAFGNVCVSVPIDQIEGGLWIVRRAAVSAGNPDISVYFSLG